MEISLGYQPFFRTTIKGLAKVKLQGHTELPRAKVYQTIASHALREGSFEDYKMLVYSDRIHFEKSQAGSSFPEIPYSSIARLVVLPNFPDVCFIHFRRNTYGMYVVFRVRKVSYLPKLAKFISTWNEANTSDTENAQAQPTQNLGGPKVEKHPRLTPIIIQCAKPQHSEGNVPRGNQRSSVKPRSKSRTPGGFDSDGPCEFVCIKHNHKAAPPRQARSRSLSPPRERFRIRVRRKSHPNSKMRNYRPQFKSQSGKYTLIVPTKKDIEPPKGFNRGDSKEKRSSQRGRVILAKASETDSQSSSSRFVELVTFKGDEVRTIYPSSLDLGRLSPKSLRNEQLVQKLVKPLDSN
ncbi:unnamed protein product [Rodentolepis nana]|uniref:DUF5733 domain-containing protein n=1 Tax=Rodentolepis nana TaxID=102285 RepID=A0A0R3TCP3_RODNA|nr:unnamed protein product [Rodentolepis nana]